MKSSVTSRRNCAISPLTWTWNEPLLLPPPPWRNPTSFPMDRYDDIVLLITCNIESNWQLFRLFYRQVITIGNERVIQYNSCSNVWVCRFLFFLYILYIFLIASCFLVYFYYSSAFIYYMSIERIENKGNGTSRHLVVGLCTAVQFRRSFQFPKSSADRHHFRFFAFSAMSVVFLVCDEFLFKLTILLCIFNLLYLPPISTYWVI